MDLLADLTDAQRQAVTHVDGPLLVLAGAGSGKTRVITRRVAYLVRQGVAPWNILAVTFTNKAAGEMQQRALSLGVPRGATIGTFHSVCARLLREFADLAGLPRDFVIYDTDDQAAVVRDAVRRLGISGELSPAAIRSAISRSKNEMQNVAELAALAGQERNLFLITAAKVYGEYQRILAANRALDFDDLLLRVVFLMRDHPDVRQRLGQRYRYILIDEYQDTNHAQYLMAHGLAMDHENICATGDPDQSIYAWRGANIRNILEFEQDYPAAKVVRLEHNYRSRAPILAAADSLIRHNRNRKRKDLLPTRGAGPDVQVIRLSDEHAEAEELAGLVRRLHDEGLRYSDIAVFYRINALSRVLETSFRRAGIPYQIARGVEFYNRKEIKDVLAYLRLLVNPNDDLSCRRVINTPPRGIGDVTVARLEQGALDHHAPLLAMCARPEAAGLGKGPALKVGGFATLIGELSAVKAPSVQKIVEVVITRTGLEASLQGDEEQRQAQKNVQELVSAAADFDKDYPEATLGEFLHQVSLVCDVDAIDPQAGSVSFMTLHAAKGLEFPAVFIIGWENGLLPFQRRDMPARNASELEEERRLAFVGITRTRDRLVLTLARNRTSRGMSMRAEESPFLAEIGQEGVQRIDKSVEDAPPPERQARRDFFRRPPSEADESFDQDQVVISEAEFDADLIPEAFAGLRPGRRVRHPTYGAGWVRSITQQGDKTRAVVDFDRFGEKTLVLQFARLEPL